MAGLTGLHHHVLFGWLVSSFGWENIEMAEIKEYKDIYTTSISKEIDGVMIDRNMASRVLRVYYGFTSLDNRKAFLKHTTRMQVNLADKYLKSRR